MNTASWKVSERPTLSKVPLSTDSLIASVYTVFHGVWE